MDPQKYVNQVIDGRYRILKPLGEGGMGVVYLGENLQLGRKVAVKLLHSEWLDDDTTVKRFFREAKVAAALRHANIINVLDVGESQTSEPYIVLEYLEGETLSELLKRAGPLDLATTLNIIEPVLGALHVTHKKGIVHRDLKPDNIFLSCPGKDNVVVKLIDFGISKNLETNDSNLLTLQGTMLGTPMYMPPEQIHNDSKLDHRADLYAIGVILYKMLTNTFPFHAENHTELIASIINDSPLPPSDAYPAFPTEAEPIISKLLQKNPKKRFKRAKSVLAAFKLLRKHAQRRHSATISAERISRTSIVAGDLGILTKNVQGQGSDITVLERRKTIR